MFQADGGGQAGGPGADDDDVVLHRLAGFFSGGGLGLGGRAVGHHLESLRRKRAPDAGISECRVAAVKISVP